jgi:hypothetical protein
LVVVDEYYNNINSKKASTGENRCFSKWPLNRDVGWVVVTEKEPEPADARTEIQQGLLQVILYHIAFLLPLLCTKSTWVLIFLV